jgi:hypothetical protein
MKRLIVRAAIAASVCQSVLFTSVPAQAQAAAAQELFDAAKKLTKEGKYAEACPKFEESLRLDPAPGTKFFLADCWEQVGRTASAWAAYVEIADASASAGQRDREKVARERVDRVAPKLTRLSVVVPEASRVPGLVVKRDGVVLREAQWGIGVPVDPGEHVIEASAENMRPWRATQKVSGEGKTITVEVPKLTPQPAAKSKPVGAAGKPAASPAGDGADQSAGSGQRTIGLIVGGVGLVGLGVGGYFGLQAFSKHDEYEKRCDSNNVCDQKGVTLNEEAVRAGNIANVAMGVGLGALATGVILYLTAPSSSSSVALGVDPALDASAGRIVVKGAWW